MEIWYPRRTDPECGCCQKSKTESSGNGRTVCSLDWREKYQLRNRLKKHLNQVASFSQGPEIPKRNNLAMTPIHYSTLEPAKHLNHETKTQASLLTVSGQGDESNWFLAWKTGEKNRLPSPKLSV